MTNLTNPKWMYLKAVLLLLIGLMCFGLLLTPLTLVQRAVLQLLMIWAFARTYYFAFYVITHYIDPGYRYAGLFDFACRLVRRGPWAGRQDGK